MSRNGRASSWSGSSMMNCMCGSCVLMCCSSCWLCFASWMTKVSSTYLRHKQAVWGRAKGLDFELFHKQISNEGANGGTHGSTMDLFIIPWKRKYVFLRQNFSNVTFCCVDMLVLWGSAGSWCSLCLTMLMEGSTKTEVKRVLTSYDVITSPGSSFTFWICCTKCWGFEGCMETVQSKGK